jgi:flagellar basal body-associated protein FliL
MKTSRDSTYISHRRKKIIIIIIIIIIFCLDIVHFLLVEITPI